MGMKALVVGWPGDDGAGGSGGDDDKNEMVVITKYLC